MSDSKLDISFDASKVLKSLEKLNLKFNETETSINNFVNSANNFINILKNIDKVSKPIKDLGTGFKNIKNRKFVSILLYVVKQFSNFKFLVILC